mmetsp:Transcript_17478/g.38305  ORF Transcript_17478/g.38305 Transcript_17478/m.38305 type:complete len:291 (+) Transcript_17478:1829-2701(+)
MDPIGKRLWAVVRRDSCIAANPKLFGEALRTLVPVGHAKEAGECLQPIAVWHRRRCRLRLTDGAELSGGAGKLAAAEMGAHDGPCSRRLPAPRSLRRATNRALWPSFSSGAKLPLLRHLSFPRGQRGIQKPGHMQGVCVEAAHVHATPPKDVDVEGIVMEDLSKVRVREVASERVFDETSSRPVIVYEESRSVAEVHVVATVTCSAEDSTTGDGRLPPRANGDVCTLRVPSVSPVCVLLQHLQRPLCGDLVCDHRDTLNLGTFPKRGLREGPYKMRAGVYPSCTQRKRPM